jgi:exonuclease VII small subunit
MRFESLLVFVISLVILPLTAHGQDTATTSSATSTDESFLEAVIDRVQTITNDTPEDTSAATLSPLEPRTQERLTNLAANISNRLEGLADRLDNISLRLERRIKKLEAQGFVVTEAQRSLNQAQASLTQAKTTLSTIDRDVYDALRSPDPLNEWKTVRRTYIEARDALAASHGHLRDTITQLKTSAPAPAPDTASSTSTNNQ